jgi:hypothetical protein
MTPPIWSLPRGLNPTPPEAREWLKQELRRSEYQSPWLDSARRWVSDRLNELIEGARTLAGLSPLITVLIALVVIALLVWILPRVRREPVTAGAPRAVLEDLTLTSGHYRDLASQALREGRYDDAVLDGFRAIARDMSDRRVLDDAPGRTAHEVSMALASPFPDHAGRLAVAADLFDSVRYGHRRVNAEQARAIPQLDDELVTARPLLNPVSPQRQPV